MNYEMLCFVPGTWATALLVVRLYPLRAEKPLPTALRKAMHVASLTRVVHVGYVLPCSTKLQRK